MLEQEIKNEISNINILDIIGQLTTLSKKDERLYIGKCPFHQQSFQSLFVDNLTQEYHCLQCGRSGNLINLIADCDINGNFVKTMNHFNIDIPEKETNELHSVCTETAKYYYNLMKNTKAGNHTYGYYKIKRGFSDEIINRFGLGYSSNKGLFNHLKNLGFSKEIILLSGVCKKGDNGIYDFFRNRAMIPIIDIDGNICGFGGRTMGEDKAKYINSAENSIFVKGNILFAFNYAKHSKREGIICCEGYMDVISMHQAGFDNAIASLGTAFTLEHAQIIKKYTNKVWLAYDSDEAGVKSTIKNLKTLRDVGINAKIIDVAPCKDPDEFLKKYGREEYEKRIKSAKDGVCFQIDVIATQYNLSLENEKESFKDEISRFLLPIVMHMGDIDKYVGYTNKILGNI